VTAVAGAIGLLGPLSQLHAIGGEVSSVILLIGLAVGVDYSMFYLRREMEERDAGGSPQAALAAAAATSGRAVLVSGLTVMIAMAGMFFAGNAQFVSFALGTILVVAIAMLGSLTFLPAMLSWLGQKGWTEKGRVPYFGRLRHRRPEGSRVWGAVLDRVLRRPAVAALLAGGLLVGLTLPALGLKTINTGIQGLPGTWRSCRPTTACRPRSRATRSPARSWCEPMTSPRPRSGPGSSGSPRRPRPPAT
jgi:RND superfamily putative drug exporter